MDFSDGWERGLTELVNNLPGGDYDEIQALRKAFRETPLGAEGRDVLSFLEAVASRKRDWKVSILRSQWMLCAWLLDRRVISTISIGG